MKVVEVKVIFDSDDIDKAQKEIEDIFYSFGVTGLQIQEPLKEKSPLDFYKDDKKFLMVDHAVSAYFPLNIYSKKREEVIRQFFNDNFKDRDDVVYTIDFYDHDEEDYENSWKKYFFTEKISKRFVVKPTWREYTPVDGELMIEIDPGRAFGTGTHPTTSLTIKLMEENIDPGDTVIDVGTGTGILMIAASKLGASEVVGTDIDQMAVDSATENLELNHISNAKVYKGDLISVIKEKKFDVVVANILPDVLMTLLDDITKIIHKNSIIIFSGIIEDKYILLEKAIKNHGLEMVDTLSDGEWRAVLIKYNKE